MPKNRKTPRGSQSEILDRLFTMLRRLMRGAAPTRELQEIVAEQVRAEGNDVGLSALQRRFEEDRSRLKWWFGCELVYSRAEESYTLTTVGQPLIDLPSDAVRGLAFLQSTFSSDAAPMSQEVRALLDTIGMVLPDERRREISRERGLLELHLQARDSDTISDDVWEKVQVGCSEHRMLEFEYVSPRNADGLSRGHRVEPIRYFFEPGRGHYYLEAYCGEQWGPNGRWSPDEVMQYRLGRMFNVRMKPNHFAPRRVKTESLVYTLAAEVARLGVTEHVAGAQVDMHGDGSATVRAQSRNLWFDLRTLLHYGANCHVIGGDKAVAEMTKLVKELAKRYEQADT